MALRKKPPIRRMSCWLWLAAAGFVSCLVVGIVVGAWYLPADPSPVITRRLGSISSGNIPLIAVGSSGDRLVAGWTSEGGTRFRSLSGDPDYDVTIPDLPFVNQILTVSDGAIAVGGDKFVLVNTSGKAVGPASRLVDFPSGTQPTYAVSGGRLVVAIGESGDPAGRISVRTYRLDGEANGPVTHIPAGGRFPGRVALAALSEDRFLLAWRGLATRDTLVTAFIDRNGAFVSPPRALYEASPGGAIQCCWASSSQAGVVVVWQDSSPGSWEIMSQAIDDTGAASAPVQLSARDGRDDLRPKVVFNGREATVAWISGIHYGLFAVTGSGRISVRPASGDTSAVDYRAPGSIESFALASRTNVLGIAAVVREGEGYSIYGAELSR